MPNCELFLLNFWLSPCEPLCELEHLCSVTSEILAQSSHFCTLPFMSSWLWLWEASAQWLCILPADPGIGWSQAHTSCLALWIAPLKSEVPAQTSLVYLSRCGSHPRFISSEEFFRAFRCLLSAFNVSCAGKLGRLPKFWGLPITHPATSICLPAPHPYVWAFLRPFSGSII